MELRAVESVVQCERSLCVPCGVSAKKLQTVNVNQLCAVDIVFSTVPDLLYEARSKHIVSKHRAHMTHTLELDPWPCSLLN